MPLKNTKKKIAAGINIMLDSFGVQVTRGRAKPWSHPKSPEIVHSTVLPRATYSPWLSDKSFNDVYRVVRDHTLVSVERLYELWSLAKQVESLNGSIIEVGVWRGGSAGVLAKAAPRKRILLADTFSGVVKAETSDTEYVGGEHADTSVAVVTALMRKLGVANTTILEGIFPDDTGDRCDEKIALLHCDVDVYESARAVVEFVKPRLVPGAIIVFDDFGFYGCEGVTRLVHELTSSAEWLMFHNLNGHAVLVKRG
jgi:O-methyltransferase